MDTTQRSSAPSTGVGLPVLNYSVDEPIDTRVGKGISGIVTESSESLCANCPHDRISVDDEFLNRVSYIDLESKVLLLTCSSSCKILSVAVLNFPDTELVSLTATFKA